MSNGLIHIGQDAIIAGKFACGIGESPVWHPQEQALYWIDIAHSMLLRSSDPQQAPDTWALPEQPGCIALAADGALVVAGTHSVFTVRPQLGLALHIERTLCTTSFAEPEMRANDGRCDRQGRLWFSSMKSGSERKPVGQWFRLDRQGLYTSPLGGFTTPNGLAFSPDGRKMYLAESAAAVRSVWVMDYDPDTGACGERKLFIDFNQHAGRPDGACVDVDGCYWVCATEAGRLLRFTPDGRLDRTLALPFRNPTMPCFGGADMQTLYVASLQRTTQKADEDPFAGCMLACRPHASGMVEVELDV